MQHGRWCCLTHSCSLSHILPPQLPDDFEVVYSQLQGEVEVGGVFLRLFIQQPNWVCPSSLSFCALV